MEPNANFNKDEYKRRIKSGELDYIQYYSHPSEVEIKKADLIAKHLLSGGFEKILDLGCSFGFYSFKFAKKNKIIVGLDYEFNSLLIARTRSLKSSNKNSPIFLNANALQLPFKDGVFDKINNVDFIEHIIPKHQLQAIKERYRVLKKTGKLIVIPLTI